MRISRYQMGIDENYKLWHNNGLNMIIYMHSSGGSIVCNERVYPIKKGALCFVGARKSHYTMPADANKYVRSKMFATDDEMRKLLSHFFTDDKTGAAFGEQSFVYAEINDDDAPAVEALFDDAMLYHDDPEYGDVIFYSCFMRLMAFISKNAIDVISKDGGFMQKALEYINDNVCMDISIDDICHHVHMSKYYFCRSFKKSAGITVMQYILKTRISLAKKMLITDKLSVSEVSERCGFSNLSYFCRVFKEDTGITPLRYVKSEKNPKRR